MRRCIPVLTYHSVNIEGNQYAGNDHVALAEDLVLVTQLGWRIRPLIDLVDDFLAGRMPAVPTLAVTLDDGSDFDFHDLPHPSAGLQRSMLNILRDFAQAHPGAQPDLHATVFAIASPAARKVLDRTCLIGKGWWNDDWWADAVASGLIGIANHSWDHVHTTLPEVAQAQQAKGDFSRVVNRADADAQIRQARDYVKQRADNPSVDLFAYPYGHCNAYLIDAYLPDQLDAAGGGVKAAFTTGGQTWTSTTNRWALPRAVCGDHWKSPDELAAWIASLL